MYILNYNGFTLQNDSYHTIDGLKGISRVDVRRSEDFLTAGDGGNIWERRYGMRIIDITGFVFADDFATYYVKRDELMAAFPINNTNENLLITKSDGITLQLSAKVIEVPDINEVSGEVATGTYQILLKAQNPFFTDSAASGGTITPAITGGTPVSSPVPSPVGSTGGVLLLTNSGDIANKASFVITGQITNPSVLNQTTGQSFTINTTINPGQTVNIYQNSTGFYVLLNNNSNYYQYFTGTFFDIVQGVNSLKFSGSSYDSGATLTVTYYNYYLGI